MLMPRDIFKTIVSCTPLVSIDLIVRDPEQRVLLGWRRNRPAQHCWFVPGGRINKDETIAEAFRRITRDELGLGVSRENARFLGVYEHLYPDCFDGEDVSTHYVVLAHELTLALPGDLPPEQHERYCWLSPSELLSSHHVHENTKAYFRSQDHN